MKMQGYTDETVAVRTGNLLRLTRLGVNICDPESVKKALSEQKWKDSYKMLLCYAYEAFMTMEKLKWIRPRYAQGESFPFIPSEQEIDQLIAATSKKLSTFLHGLKDTGADPGELIKLRWIDINKEAKTLSIRPIKGHNPRISKISEQFINMLERLPKTSELVFKNYENMKSTFFQQRKRIAEKFTNQRLRKISFTTFRHWKGTMEYHRTRDILYVKKILGHKRIQNTLKYIDLEATIFNTVDDQWTARVATDVKEACTLTEAGFEYVTGEYSDGGKIFRKRK
jgi:integrase